MTFERRRFWEAWAVEFGTVDSPARVQAVQQLLGFIEADRPLTSAGNIPWIAYILATVKHETGNTFLPVEEVGRGRGHQYGEPCVLAFGRSVIYYGRGYPQLTWLANYMRMSMELGLDLVTDPDVVLKPAIAYRVMSAGMRLGRFTGRKLADFLSSTEKDYVNARTIINGHDRAELIAGYAEKFERILRAAQEVTP